MLRRVLDWANRLALEQYWREQPGAASTPVTEPERDLPRKLYKYRSLGGDSFRYTQQIVLRRELYFSPLALLNDPYEGAYVPSLDPSVVEAFEKGALSMLPGRNRPSSGPSLLGPTLILKNAEAIASSIGVLSLSEKCNDTLMWSHYGGQHEGVCIEFDARSTFFSRARHC